MSICKSGAAALVGLLFSACSAYADTPPQESESADRTLRFSASAQSDRSLTLLIKQCAKSVEPAVPK
jgi:hypothetical protein